MSNPMWKKPALPTTRITGHALDAEGAAFSNEGERLQYNTVAGEGCGQCECGARSTSLPAGAHRKAWHREHKAQIAATAVTGGAVGAGGAGVAHEGADGARGAVTGAQEGAQ